MAISGVFELVIAASFDCRVAAMLPQNSVIVKVHYEHCFIRTVLFCFHSGGTHHPQAERRCYRVSHPCKHRIAIVCLRMSMQQASSQMLRGEKARPGVQLLAELKCPGHLHYPKPILAVACSGHVSLFPSLCVFTRDLQIQIAKILARLDVGVFPPFVPRRDENPIGIAIERGVESGTI